MMNKQIKMTAAGTRGRWGRPLAAVAAGAMLAISLQGCFGILAGGAVIGTFAATDRRTLGTQTEDKAIVVKGESRIPGVVAAGSHVNVTSFDRKVLLTGEVPNEASKAAAEREIRSLPNVDGVFNELAVLDSKGIGGRSEDTFITSKVVASLVDTKNLYANAFKVTTERGVVYLMGRVTKTEGDKAAEVARGVSGVQKVVTLFEYITEEQLKQYTTQPASTPSDTSGKSSS